MQSGESDPERPQDDGGRPERRERELLWVESVSERLLGGQAPRPWERVYFDRDTDEAPGEQPEVTDEHTVDSGPVAAQPTMDGRAASAPEPAERVDTPRSEHQPEQVDHGSAHPSGEESSVTFPTSNETSAPAAESQARVFDLTGGDAGPSDDEILSAALVSGNAALAAAVVDLLDSRARDRARVASLERALRVLLTQVERSPETLTGASGASLAAVLHRVLAS